MSETARVSDNILKRIYLLFTGFVFFAVLVVWQIFRLQVVQGPRWQAVQEQERVYYKRVLANRGSILSSDGSILAITLPFYRAAMDVTVIRKRDFESFDDSLDLFCRKMALHFGQGEFDANYFKANFLRARQSRDRHYYLLPVSRVLNHQEMKLLRSLPMVNRGRFKGGLIIEKVNNKRFYPFGDLARITLGLMREDSIPIKGLEFAYNGSLRGQDGLALVQRVPGGVEIPLSETEDVESHDGHDIQTTLDVNMQDVVMTALQRGVARTQAKGGCAILMEVATGEIKAIANHNEDYNHAFATQYEPGSTFKLASIMATLEEGHVQPNDTLYAGQGESRYYDRVMRDVHPYGRLSLQEAFEKSSNVAISKAVVKSFGSKPGKFIEHLDRMGILNMSGIHIKGEPTPYLIRPDNKMWNGTTLPWLSIGYNIRLTPLQLLSFYNAVANNGTMVRPVLVRRIYDNAADIAHVTEPQVINPRICSPKVLAQVRLLMEGVVAAGTASNIKGTHYKIAGKTGTAQKIVDGKYQKIYRASFAGYFPAHQPRYSCIVLIDEPKGGEVYGSQAAAPIFKEIADNIHATDLALAQYTSAELTSTERERYPITPVVHLEDAKVVYGKLNISSPDRPSTPLVRSRQQGRTVSLQPVRHSKNRMPDVLGMTAKDALALLENQGMRVRLVGTGRVREQSIESGTALSARTYVTLTLH